MTEQSTAQDDFLRSRRRRRLAIAGAAAAALAVIGGVAGGVAAMVSRSSSSSGGGSATLFFPAVGQGGALGQSAGNSAGGAAMAQGAAGAPAMAPDLAVRSTGGLSYASSGGASFAYPAYGCGTPPEAQVQGDGITATGMVQVPLGSGAGGSATTLNIGIQSQNNADVRTALADARARIAAIRDAVHRAGVPLSQITEQNLNIWANGNPKVTNSNVNDGLTVTITDASLVDPAITAAVGAGASNLNLWSSAGTSAATPTDDQVRTAITKATAQAHSMAQAVAQGAGVALGKMRASAVQAPAICPWAPGGPQLVVAVTVTYATS